MKMSIKNENLKNKLKANVVFTNIGQNYNKIIPKAKPQLTVVPLHKRTQSDFPVNFTQHLELQIDHSKLTQLDKSTDALNSRYFTNLPNFLY